MANFGVRPLYVHNVARRLGVPRRTVRHWAKTGKLPATKSGPGIWVFDLDQVVQFGARRVVDEAA